MLCLIPCPGNSQSAGSGGGHTEHRLAARLRSQELDWYVSTCCLFDHDIRHDTDSEYCMV